MTVYFTVMFLWWFYYYLNISAKQKYHISEEKTNKKNAIFMGFVLFLLMGLRGFDVGIDTLPYKMNYFDVVLPNPSKYFFEKKEWGFYTFVAWIKMFFSDYQAFLLITAGIVSLSFSLLFYKTSKNIFLSFLLHMTLGLFTMSMSAIRQTLAVSFTMFAFLSMRWKGHAIFKFLFYCLLLYLAYIFHNSAVVFIPVILFQKIKLTKRNAIWVFVITVILALCRTLLTPLIEFFMPTSYSHIRLMSDVYKLNPILGILAIFLPLICLLFWNSKQWDDEYWNLNSVLFVMSCLNVVTVFLGYNSNILNRLSYYFTSYNMVLIPNIIESIVDKKTRTIGFILCIILSILAFAISTPGGTLQIDKYKFFWQV